MRTIIFKLAYRENTKQILYFILFILSLNEIKYSIPMRICQRMEFTINLFLYDCFRNRKNFVDVCYRQKESENFASDNRIDLYSQEILKILKVRKRKHDNSSNLHNQNLSSFFLDKLDSYDRLNKLD